MSKIENNNSICVVIRNSRNFDLKTLEEAVRDWDMDKLPAITEIFREAGVTTLDEAIDAIWSQSRIKEKADIRIAQYTRNTPIKPGSEEYNALYEGIYEFLAVGLAFRYFRGYAGELWLVAYLLEQYGISTTPTSGFDDRRNLVDLKIDNPVLDGETELAIDVKCYKWTSGRVSGKTTPEKSIKTLEDGSRVNRVIIKTRWDLNGITLTKGAPIDEILRRYGINPV